MEGEEEEYFAVGIMGACYLSFNGVGAAGDVEQGLYWALIVAAHVFFARVLIQCYSKPSFVEKGHGINILDDIEG